MLLTDKLDCCCYEEWLREGECSEADTRNYRAQEGEEVGVDAGKEEAISTLLIICRYEVQSFSLQTIP